MKALISSYVNTVGDIEQTRISQEISIDPLLKCHGKKIHSIDANTLSKTEEQQLLQWATIEKDATYPDVCVHVLFETQAAITGSPIVYDDIVYIGSTDHQVYALFA